jgi:hypothetical protein
MGIQGSAPCCLHVCLLKFKRCSNLHPDTSKLQTPNKYVAVADVPAKQAYRDEVILCNLQRRYTLQDFCDIPESEGHLSWLPSDAMFLPGTDIKDLPHPILLHWCYGSAALSQWAVKNNCYDFLSEHDATIVSKEIPDPDEEEALDESRRVSGMNAMFGIMNFMLPSHGPQDQERTSRWERT